MFAIGLNGSPRKNGNSEFLLTHFMAELSRLGVNTRVLDVGKFRIEPCREIALCEREGMCAIRDEMSSDIYGLLRRADIVVIASPIFFYGVSAQLKALIDRSQALWARRYMHKVLDPGQRTRRGFVLAVGATRGKKLFDGVLLTARYFFDAIGATPSGSLTYRQVETRGQIQEHPTVLTDLVREAQTLAAGLIERPKVLVVGHADSCRGQMAAAFLQRHAGERLDVLSAGTEPAAAVDPRMVEVMREIGIDMASVAGRSPGLPPAALGDYDSGRSSPGRGSRRRATGVGVCASGRAGPGENAVAARCDRSQSARLHRAASVTAAAGGRIWLGIVLKLKYLILL
jgi:multimeric flavodoxin WrbA